MISACVGFALEFQITCKGLNVINPLAAIGALAMLLKQIGETKASDMVEASIKDVVRTKLKDVAAKKMGYSTTEVGDLVVKGLK